MWFVGTKKSQALSVSPGLQLPNAITSLNSGTIICKAKAFDKKKESNHVEKTENGQDICYGILCQEGYYAQMVVVDPTFFVVWYLYTIG